MSLMSCGGRAFEWEIARSLRRLASEEVDDNLNGLFAPVAAFSGSQFPVEFPEDYLLEKVDQELVRAIAKQELGMIGLPILRLARKRGVTRKNDLKWRPTKSSGSMSFHH
jgi:hypothetical protein